jgi:RimJ/RimL family protein N-acetyltransferase
MKTPRDRTDQLGPRVALSNPVNVTPDHLLDPSNWRDELPPLTARLSSLREPSARDGQPLLDLLSLDDAPRFGIEGLITPASVQRFIDRAVRDRAAGIAFTYVITLNPAHNLVGLLQVRQLDPAFECAEWDGVLLPSVRGSGAFLEAARLVGSFVFGVVGTHRLEARVSLSNGRANGAIRKLGAVQEGVLRRSLRRGGEYLDQSLWSVLKEDWGTHWVATGPRVH